MESPLSEMNLFLVDLTAMVKLNVLPSHGGQFPLIAGRASQMTRKQNGSTQEEYDEKGDQDHSVHHGAARLRPSSVLFDPIPSAAKPAEDHTVILPDEKKRLQKKMERSSLKLKATAIIRFSSWIPLGR